MQRNRKSSPKHADAKPVIYLPLDVALVREFPNDMHFAAYSAPDHPYRLCGTALSDAGPELLPKGMEMVAALFDVDGHADEDVDAWWSEQLPRIDGLLEVHPGAFIYRTRGGYRIVYRISLRLADSLAADSWKGTYCSWVAYLARRFGIVADPSCKDWTRLYRLPRVTRDGRLERREMIGDPARIGWWQCTLSDEDRAAGKKHSERAARSRPHDDAPGAALDLAGEGEGVLFQAFKARGWMGPKLEDGKWAVACPWEEQHTTGSRLDGSTVLWAPARGGALGLMHCSHGHCAHRDFRDVLDLFSEDELSQARQAAGAPAFGKGTLGAAAVTATVETSTPVDPCTLAEVEDAYRRWFHMPDTDPLLVALATTAAALMSGDPVWTLFVSPPSTSKTEIVQSVAKQPGIYPAATLTEASLLSGSSARERAKNAHGGLLRLIGSCGIILCKDFGSVLNMNRDARQAVLAALREIYDGSWTRHVGSDGGQTLSWEGQVGFIGCVTPTIDRHHAVMSSLGERFLLVRLVPSDPDRQGEKALEQSGHEAEMRAELRAKVAGLFAGFCPPTPVDLTPEETKALVRIARFVALARSAVERDGFSREVELIPGPEGPGRLAKTLKRLFGALLAIGADRQRAWRIIRRVAFDCIPVLRFQAFEAVRAATRDGSRIDTKKVATKLGYPTVTVRKALEELVAYKLVQRHPGGQGKADKWSLGNAAEGLEATFSEVSDATESAKPSVSIHTNTVNDDKSEKVPERQANCARGNGLGNQDACFEPDAFDLSIDAALERERIEREKRPEGNPTGGG